MWQSISTFPKVSIRPSGCLRQSTARLPNRLVVSSVVYSAGFGFIKLASPVVKEQKMKNPTPCGVGFLKGIGFAADQPGVCSEATTRKKFLLPLGVMVNCLRM